VQVVTGSVTAAGDHLTFWDDLAAVPPLTIAWSAFDDMLRVTASGDARAARSSTWRRVGTAHAIGSEVRTYVYGSRSLVLAGLGNANRYAGTTPSTGNAVRWLGHYRFDGHVLELDPDRSCRTCPAGGRFDWAPDDTGGGAMVLWPHAGVPAASYWATPVWTPAG
jgi:hypothetical protein